MTSTDLATAAPAQAGLALPATATTRNLEQWASELAHAYQIASTICQTSFVPQHFRDKPEECAAAILYGDSLGIAPMVAVRSIYSVHGTPALYAQAMYAIALSKGHQIERVYADQTRVEFRCRRKGAKDWQKVEWTIARAEQAKYTSNAKYRENPIGMLTEKCKAEAAKLVAAEALSGLNSVEEIILGDYEDLGEPEPAAPAPAAAPRPNTAAARLLAAPAPAPTPAPEPAEAPSDDVVDEDTGEVPDEPDDAPVRASEAQIVLLRKAMDAAGHKTPRQKATAIADKLGESKAPHELTPEDADLLIQLFEADAARGTDG